MGRDRPHLRPAVVLSQREAGVSQPAPPDRLSLRLAVSDGHIARQEGKALFCDVLDPPLAAFLGALHSGVDPMLKLSPPGRGGRCGAVHRGRLSRLALNEQGRRDLLGDDFDGIARGLEPGKVGEYPAVFLDLIESDVVQDRNQSLLSQ